MTRSGRVSAPLRLAYGGSAGDPSEWPRWGHVEIAIAGRSNAGKSSLLNRLAGERGLARTSRTPGRTRRLHFFVDEASGLCIVDLPGYGFARASRAERSDWGRFVEDYLGSRQDLAGLLLVHDVRRDPGPEEAAVDAFCRERGLELVPVATKVDKLGRGERTRRLRALGNGWIPFSSRTGEGADEVRAALRQLVRS